MTKFQYESIIDDHEIYTKKNKVYSFITQSIINSNEVHILEIN